MPEGVYGGCVCLSKNYVEWHWKVEQNINNKCVQERLTCSVKYTNKGYPCYPLLPLVTLVIPCYAFLPPVTPCYPCYPLLPLLPLATLVTPCYPC